MDKIVDDALSLSAYLKFIEHILHEVSTGENELTIADIKQSFKEKFSIDLPYLLSPNFALLRLIPLLFIKEDYKSNKNQLNDQIKKTIKVIRDSIAHADTEFDRNGVTFTDGKTKITMSYNELVEFIFKIENSYYPERINGKL